MVEVATGGVGASQRGAESSVLRLNGGRAQLSVVTLQPSSSLWACVRNSSEGGIKAGQKRNTVTSPAVDYELPDEP